METKKRTGAILDAQLLPEVMTADEAGSYLGISRPTLMKYVARGDIPGKKLGHRWRFMRDELRACASGNMAGTGKHAEAPLPPEPFTE